MKRFLLSIVGLMAFVIGVNAETYTHTFKEGELTTTGGTVTLSGMEWAASSATSIGWSKERGIQFGSKNTACPSFTLTTSAFKDYTITSVTVYSSIASSGDSKLTIKAGNSVSEQYVLTGTHKAYTFDGFKEQGNITISWNSTQRAYYVSKIEVVYELPSDMVDVEEPTFITPQGVYENEVFVVAETSVASDTLYYTIDGTIPSFEEYHSEPRVGTTKRSGYYVLNETLKNSATIKAIAIRVDGESLYQSDVVEAKYIVSETKPYVPAKEITTGNKYAFVAKDSVADFLFGATEGYMQSRKISGKHNKYIETVAYSGFTFTSTNGGYIIQDAEERYMYLAGNDGKVSFATEKPATGAVWSVSIDNNGKATIKNGNNILHYVANEDIFGCYATANSNMELPSLYMQREYPKAVITPENGSTVKGLQEIVITCEEGIAVSDNFKLKAVGLAKKEGGYEIDKTYNCQRVDNNTLKFTIDTPIATEDNVTLEMVFEGNILLNPSEIEYSLPSISRYGNVICSYTHQGNAAPAELLSITPENNSTIEELYYLIFTFSKIATSRSEDAKLQPRLYAEGISWNYILENTPTNSNGDVIAMDQLALKTSETILGNGTYILEIPTGCFIDRNGNNIEGTTIKFTVKNDSGLAADIEDIIEDNNNWVVYNITGVKVLDTDNAEDLNTLSRGIYIINNRKVIVR
ncbi:MAG: chitobiase/beta-hexosaminidase C-terminal domain-containing protein [Bacteroidaceae bacterium]|nr:chitobiase/beta-hexosaminidase C-terminal domain-containing protein [Bacteroidaceae bacterium]